MWGQSKRISLIRFKVAQMYLEVSAKKGISVVQCSGLLGSELLMITTDIMAPNELILAKQIPCVGFVRYVIQFLYMPVAQN